MFARLWCWLWHKENWVQVGVDLDRGRWHVKCWKCGEYHWIKSWD